MNAQSDMFGPEFDRDKAEAARDEGIRRVAANNVEFLKEVRAIARKHIAIFGEATADDVRRRARVQPAHPNAWGALFKHRDFAWTGQYRKSALVQGHGNLQRIWRMNHANQD